MSTLKASLIKSTDGARQEPITEGTAFLHVHPIDRKFWTDVYSGLVIITKAIYRRWIGGEPRCKHCKQVL